jgi:hypothetical protein
MNKKYKKDLLKAFEALREVDKLLTERIAENNTFKGQTMTEQATHCYVLYRKMVWKAKYKIRAILNDEGESLFG